MAFKVYPVPNRPLPVDPAAPGALVPFGELADMDSRLMFIRVAKTGTGSNEPGPSEPTIRIKVDDGDPTDVPTDNTTGPVFGAPGGSSGGGEHVADVGLLAVPDDNVYLVLVRLMSTGHRWHLQIFSNDYWDKLQFTWVVADNVEETQQPWIDLVTPELTFVMSSTQSETKHVRLTNRGTGPLWLTNHERRALNEDFFLENVPEEIAPAASASIGISCLRPSPGGGELVHQFESNDPHTGTLPGHNPAIRLIKSVTKSKEGKETTHPGEGVPSKTDFDI